MSKFKVEIGIFIGTFLILFFSWFLFYKLNINSLPLQSEDVLPSIFTGITLTKEGTLYLDSYYEMMVSKYPQPDDVTKTPFYLRKVGDHYLSAFPIMNTLLTLPIFFIYSFFVSNFSWSDIYLLSHLSGSFIISLSALFMFILLTRVLRYSQKTSLLLTFTYCFATINLPLISQALWQHGAVQLFIILTIIFYLKERYFYTFFFLGLAILSRPTAIILLVILGIFILVNKKFNLKNFFMSLFGISIPLLFFIIYNFVFYQDLSNQGYSSQLGNSWLGNFPESFIGIWLSPSKGLLVYSPVFIFSLIGIWRGMKQNQLLKISFWMILLHTLVLSKWKHWYGGFGYGYRMISDVIPFFIFPIGYLLENYYKKVIKVFILTLTVSLIIQFSGLVFFDSIWHNAYDKGFRETGWLWSLENSEAMFNYRRVLVKLGFLDKACEQCLPD